MLPNQELTTIPTNTVVTISPNVLTSSGPLDIPVLKQLSTASTLEDDSPQTVTKNNPNSTLSALPPDLRKNWQITGLDDRSPTDTTATPGSHRIGTVNRGVTSTPGNRNPRDTSTTLANPRARGTTVTEADPTAGTVDRGTTATPRSKLTRTVNRDSTTTPGNRNPRSTSTTLANPKARGSTTTSASPSPDPNTSETVTTEANNVSRGTTNTSATGSNRSSTGTLANLTNRTTKVTTATKAVTGNAASAEFLFF